MWGSFMATYKVRCKGNRVRVEAPTGWHAIRAVADMRGERLVGDAEVHTRRCGREVCRQRLYGGSWVIAYPKKVLT